MRAMPETDIITLRPMEEFVNHIGVDELSVYKDLFVWILLLCVFHGEKGHALPLRTSCRGGECPHCCPLRKGHSVSTAKLGYFLGFTKKKQIFSPSALPKCRYRLAFRTARLHFSGTLPHLFCPGRSAGSRFMVVEAGGETKRMRDEIWMCRSGITARHRTPLGGNAVSCHMLTIAVGTVNTGEQKSSL